MTLCRLLRFRLYRAQRTSASNPFCSFAKWQRTSLFCSDLSSIKLRHQPRHVLSVALLGEPAFPQGVDVDAVAASDLAGGGRAVEDPAMRAFECPVDDPFSRAGLFNQVQRMAEAGKPAFQLIEEERKRAAPWNKGKLLGQRRPLKLKEIWGIRIRLQMEHRIRVLALFNLAIYSKLRGCDLVKL